MEALPGKPLSLLDVFCSGIILYQKNVTRIILISLLFACLTTGYDLAVPAHHVQNLVHHGRFSWTVFFFVSVGSLMTMIVYGTIFNMLNFTRSKSERGVVKSLIDAFCKLPYLIVTGFVINIIVMLGYCVLLVPGIYLFVLFSIALPLVLIENCGPLSAIRRSADLVYRHWWRTLVACLGPVAVYWLLLSTVESGLLYLSAKGWMSAAWVFNWYQIVTVIFLALFVPLLCSIIYIFINDLRNRMQDKPSFSKDVCTFICWMKSGWHSFWDSFKVTH